MAEHGDSRFNGPETLEALADERLRTWHGFTNAIVATAVFVVALLIGMAVFLL
jgi:hypothetical protein